MTFGQVIVFFLGFFENDPYCKNYPALVPSSLYRKTRVGAVSNGSSLVFSGCLLCCHSMEEADRALICRLYSV